MNTKNVTALTFVGRPFPDQMMDEQRTFTQANAQMEENQSFQSFLKENQLENRRSSMVVFGPENFMYWYGVLVENGVKVPADLMKFKLPSAQIAEIESKGNLNSFNTPLNFVIPAIFKKLGEAGAKVYENPGDSNTPYLIQDLDLDKKILKQAWYEEAK